MQRRQSKQTTDRWPYLKCRDGYQPQGFFAHSFCSKDGEECTLRRRRGSRYGPPDPRWVMRMIEESTPDAPLPIRRRGQSKWLMERSYPYPLPGQKWTGLSLATRWNVTLPMPEQERGRINRRGMCGHQQLGIAHHLGESLTAVR